MVLAVRGETSQLQQVAVTAAVPHCIWPPLHLSAELLDCLWLGVPACLGAIEFRHVPNKNTTKKGLEIALAVSMEGGSRGDSEATLRD